MFYFVKTEKDGVWRVFAARSERDAARLAKQVYGPQNVVTVPAVQVTPVDLPKLNVRLARQLQELAR